MKIPLEIFGEKSPMSFNCHSHPFWSKNYQDLKDQKKKLDKNYQEDQKAAQQEKDRLKALTVGCVQQLGRCLSASGSGGLTQVACRFLSLWFDHNLDYPEVPRQWEELMNVWIYLIFCKFVFWSCIYLRYDMIVFIYTLAVYLFEVELWGICMQYMFLSSLAAGFQLRTFRESWRRRFQSFAWMLSFPSFTN